MSTANTPQTGVPHLIEQRLDAVDRALVGMLPRQERLAAVAQLEARMLEFAAAHSTLAASLDVPMSGQPATGQGCSQMTTETRALATPAPYFGPGSGGWAPATPKRRSRLAISAAVLGVLALGLLFAIPVTYFAAVAFSDLVGEFVAIAMMGLHALAIAAGGLAAIGLGIAALISLRRNREQLVGHGWAIAGLCAGPLPLFVGCSAVLVGGLQLCAAEMFTVSVKQVACAADSPKTPESEDETSPSRNGMPVPQSVCTVPPQPVYGVPQSAYGSSPSVEYVPGPPVQAAGHEVHVYPSENPQPSAAAAVPTVPTLSVSPQSPPQPSPVPRAEPSPQAEPQPTLRPESPAEPVPMPESAPAISR